MSFEDSLQTFGPKRISVEVWTPLTPPNPFWTQSFVKANITVIVNNLPK